MGIRSNLAYEVMKIFKNRRMYRIIILFDAIINILNRLISTQLCSRTNISMNIYIIYTRIFILVFTFYLDLIPDNIQNTILRIIVHYRIPIKTLLKTVERLSKKQTYGNEDEDEE